jgi:HK97 family phage portal protein
MRLWKRRAPVYPEATNAVPTSHLTPTAMIRALWATVSDGGSVYMQDSIGAVDRCLQLNAQQIATMPLRYRHATDVQGYLPAWVNEPDPAWYPNGIGDAVFSAVWSIYARGEAFLWATSRYDGSGYPRTWTVLEPTSMHVEERGGQRRYRSNGVDLDTEDVLHVMRNPHGQLQGTSALTAWWASLESLYQADAYAADVYLSTGVNRVALRSSRRLDQGQAEQVQADWVAAVSKRLGAPAILPPDLELLQVLSVSPKDLLLMESREWDTRQIAAAFGVPAILLNLALEGALVYQNPQQLAELWWRTELMPTAVKLARALSRWLPRGHWVEFDPGQAVRPDLSQMVAIYSQALGDGAVSVDEYRAAVFDLPPLPEGDAAEEIFEADGAHNSEGSQPSPDDVEVVIA